MEKNPIYDQIIRSSGGQTYGKWLPLTPELGKGGQGIVFKCVNIETLPDICSELWRKWAGPGDDIKIAGLVDGLKGYCDLFDKQNTSALKIIPVSADDKARGRLREEVEALGQLNHPNIIKIIDSNLIENWFVMEFHENGSIDKHKALYQGKLLDSLLVISEIVDAVKEIHSIGKIHRDIKTANIFLSEGGHAILGDFGLVFSQDKEERLTDTYENTGSRDWMPPWAYGKKVDELKPNFDIYCLGKVLWAIVSGKTKITDVHYGYKAENTLESLFPEMPEMEFVSYIIKKCVVLNEDQCKITIDELSKMINDSITAIKRNIQPLTYSQRRCLVCGKGTYERKVDTETRNFKDVLVTYGLEVRSEGGYILFSCNYCGHIQLFYIPHIKNDIPPAWIDKKDGFQVRL